MLGLGLLAKAFFLAAVPAVIAVLAWAVWKRRLRLRVAVASLAIAAAIAGWWYARNLRITGGFSTAIQDAALSQMPLAERLRHIPDVNWRAALDSTFFSHIWFGGWSFLQVRAWIYRVFAIAAALAALGVVAAWFREARARQDLTVLASIYLLFCGGVAYHVLLTFLANGISSSAGWYLCAVLTPEVILATAGLRAILPGALRIHVPGAAAMAFAMLDLYAMLFVALPYYSGLIAHKPGGSMESFHFASLSHTGLAEVARRLASNKPGFIGPAAIAVTACAYVAATAGLAALAVIMGAPSTGRGRRRAAARR